MGGSLRISGLGLRLTRETVKRFCPSYIGTVLSAYSAVSLRFSLSRQYLFGGRFILGLYDHLALTLHA